MAISRIRSGCSSDGSARPCQGRGHEFETRHPLQRFTSGVSWHSLPHEWCARLGMCAARARATCSETPHPTGCSRLGTAEVNLSSMSRSSSGPGLRVFSPATRVRFPHAIPDRSRNRSHRRAHASVAEIGRNHWAAPTLQSNGPKAEGSARAIESSSPIFQFPIAQWVERLAVDQEVRGSKPRRGASLFLSSIPRVAQWQSSVLIRRRPVDRSHPRGPESSRCSAAGSARALGARGRRFEPCRRDQIDRHVCLGVAVAQWQSRGM